MTEMTYKIPAPKATDTSTFARIGSFKCQILQSGRSRIRISEMTLMEPVMTRLTLVSTHEPLIDASHALGTGLHWKMTDNTLAV